MIYIIADDLTGANDTGVQFAKQGYTTHVIFMDKIPEQPSPITKALRQKPDVLVIDTETRDADITTVRHRLKQILAHIKPTDTDIIYKKVDSTLRGHIGLELDECLSAFQQDLCIFTPSYPPTKRITVGGYLLVQNQPLGVSEYYTGELKPEDASFIPTLLQSETSFPIVRLDLRTLIKGPDAIREILDKARTNGQKIVVADAMNEEQLRSILLASFKFEGSILYSGSAGLANSLCELYREHVPPAPSSQEPQPEQSVLIVSGTRRSIAKRQVEYLKKNIPGLLEVDIAIEHILSKRKESFTPQLQQIAQAIQNGRHIILRPVLAPEQDAPSASLDFQNGNGTPSQSEQEVQQLLFEYRLTFRDLEVMIRNFLGEFVAAILQKTPLRNLILTGGDTAIGICASLRIQQLHLREELLPGIPLALGYAAPNSRLLKIVTKAGGFGEEDTFYLLINKLTSENNHCE